jgi:endonuclease YncB( thermonuclease family)
MRTVSFISLIIFVLCLSLSEAKENEFVVTKVLDGDTVVLDSGDTVRYLGVEAPHLKKSEGGSQFYSREALRFNKSLVLLKKVRLEFEGPRKDEQGRLLAYVHVKNVFVNGELVRLGYARASERPPNNRYRTLLLGYEKDAAGRYAGLWQEERAQTNPYYVGNKRTHTFHKPTCPLAGRIPEKNRIIFRNRVDAIRIGYMPCKRCRP